MDGARPCLLTPDGRRAVTGFGEEGGALVVWDLERGAEVTRFVGPGRARDCALAAACARAVSAHTDGSLRLWERETGQELAAFDSESRGRVSALALSPNGERIVAGLSSREIKIWRAAQIEGAELAEGPAQAWWGADALAVHPDGRRLAVATADELRVCDLETGRLRVGAEATGSWGRPDARLCAVTAGASVDVWSLESGSKLGAWRLGRSRTTWALSPEGGRAVVFIGPDASLRPGERVPLWPSSQMLKIWDLSAGAERSVPVEPGVGVLTCAVGPGGRLAVAGAENGAIQVWDLDTGRVQARWSGGPAPVRACAVSPDGDRVVTGDQDGTLTIWDLATGRRLASWVAHEEGVTDCAVTQDGQRIVSRGEDGTQRWSLRSWDLDTGRQRAARSAPGAWLSQSFALLGTLVLVCGLRGPGAQYEVLRIEDEAGEWARRCAALPAVGDLVVTRALDCLLLCDLETGQELASWNCSGDYLFASAVSMQRPMVALVRDQLPGETVPNTGEPSQARVLDLEDGSVTALRTGLPVAVRTYGVTPDGRRGLSTFDDEMVRVWDLDSGEALMSLADCVVDQTEAAILAAQGDQVILRTKEGLRVWDMATGRPQAVLEQSRSMRSWQITPDSRQVVGFDYDDSLKIWDLDSGRLRSSLAIASGHVIDCAVTPDGRRVVAIADVEERAGWLRIWDLATGRCLQAIDAPFHCLTVGQATVCAADHKGNLWTLDLAGAEDPARSARSIVLFLGHAPADAQLAEQLQRHLRPLSRQGLIDIWHVGMVKAGQTKEAEARNALEAADVVVVLVSANLLADEPSYAATQRALARQAAGHVRVVPVLARPVELKGTVLEGVQVLPAGGLPVTRWQDQEDAWVSVAGGVRDVISAAYGRTHSDRS